MESLILSVELCRRSYSPTTYLLAPVIASSLDLVLCLHANFNIRQERLPLRTGRILSAIRVNHSLKPLKVTVLTPTVSVVVALLVLLYVASGLDIPHNSQPPGISLSVSSTDDASSSVYQPKTESTSQPVTSPSDNVKLPEFQPVAPSHFHWCPVGSSTFCQSLDSAYQEVVHWKKSNFEVPRGSVGKQFVSELALVFRAVGEGSALESVAVKAVFLHVVCCCRSLLVPLNLRNTPPCWNNVCNSGMMARLAT